MTKWLPVAFADVKVGDKTKAVTASGTVIVGTVADVRSVAAFDADSRLIARCAWTLFRRAPKFVALDVPSVGQWGRFELRDGSVVEGRVIKVDDHSKPPTSSPIPCWAIYLTGDMMRMLYILNVPNGDHPRDILAWHPIDPPTPQEPEGFGCVGDVVDAAGDAWQVFADNCDPGIYNRVRVRDGEYERESWPDILALGTFTAVER